MQDNIENSILNLSSKKTFPSQKLMLHRARHRPMKTQTTPR